MDHTHQTWHGVGIEHWDPVDGLLWTWSSQELTDSGDELAPEGWDDLPYHANSVKFHTDALGDAVYVSLYGAKEIWRLNRDTGERTHVFGPDRTFELVDVSGAPLPPSEWSYVQHDPDYTTDGRVLLYDNGQGRPGGSYSRVAEYELYLIDNVATLLWTWTEPGWYDPIVGDADYLDNGNYLVMQGFSLDWSWSSDDASELVELSPTREGVGSLTRFGCILHRCLVFVWSPLCGGWSHHAAAAAASFIAARDAASRAGRSS